MNRQGGSRCEGGEKGWSRGNASSSNNSRRATSREYRRCKNVRSYALAASSLDVFLIIRHGYVCGLEKICISSALVRGGRKGTHISQLLLVLDHQCCVDLYFRRSKGGCSNEFETGVTIEVNALVSVRDRCRNPTYPTSFRASHKNGRSKL